MVLSSIPFAIVGSMAGVGGYFLGFNKEMSIFLWLLSVTIPTILVYVLVVFVTERKTEGGVE